MTFQIQLKSSKSFSSINGTKLYHTGHTGPEWNRFVQKLFGRQNKNFIIQMCHCEYFLSNIIFYLCSKFLTLLSNPKYIYRYFCTKMPEIKILFSKLVLASIFWLHTIFNLCSKFFTLFINPKCINKYFCTKWPDLKISFCKSVQASIFWSEMRIVKLWPPLLDTVSVDEFCIHHKCINMYPKKYSSDNSITFSCLCMIPNYQ